MRRLGFARSRAESTEGVGSIAVAIVDNNGIGRGAISISAPLTRITPEAEARWVEGAKEAAERVRAQIWGRPVEV